MTKTYSQLAVAIDLVSHHYQTSNPIEIAELIEQDLGIETSIHAISDYLDINRQNYEKQSNKIEYEESSRMS
jgi:hypothetical protein